MQQKDIVKTVEELISPLFDNNIYELFDIEFVKEGPNWYLRVFADKKSVGEDNDKVSNGISIEDLEILSRGIEKIMDKSDPISQAYVLEVSSPGIDRPLKKEKDYVKYAGEIVDIKLYKAIDKKKEFQGKLLGLNDGIVSIEGEGGVRLEFSLKDIAICRLAVIF
ncbi:MAG: ribosome maturation factor RimP [Clostridiales bacterium]|nr:ribosome maturation factor RimP [Clostridiales bacterium]